MVVFVIWKHFTYTNAYQRKITKLLNGANKHACFNVGGGGLLMGIEKHSIGILSVGNSCFFGKLLRKLYINFSETHSTNFSKNR